MNIDSIQNGIVIDHITAGKGMRLFELLGLDRLDASVAIIKNAHSEKRGKKDIIKIDADIPVDVDVIGFVDPGATVNVIRDGELSEKKRAELPQKLVNIIRCRNPRCITTAESQLDAVFLLSDPQRRTYRCAYCDAPADNAFPYLRP